MRTCAILAALLVAPALFAEDKSPVKEVPTKGLKIAFPKMPGGIKKPEIVTSAAQLAESPALKGAADEIGKQIDFDKQKLVFVAWSGSSGDKLLMETKFADTKPPNTKLVVTYRVTPGAETDLYKHTRLFVVPKEAAVAATGGN